MSNLASKNQARTPDYDKNLRRLLGWERNDLKVLRESAGILKGKLKKGGVAYQREIRKEWEVRLKRLEKLWKR